MEITASLVKDLRERTGAGMMDCKKALLETLGDLDKAIIVLREKGLAAAAKRAGRETSEGMVDAYIHMGGKIGVLIEVNCETDFVAKNAQFQALVHDLAMQVAASRPLYVSRDQVPEELVRRESEIYRSQAINEGKPEKFADKIVQGRMTKFYQEVCLLDQPFIRDPEKTVADLIGENIGTIGENISVRRFVRFERGESL
ncbi:MAG TPA: translation elongation factor Ts [Firmicutes bacterium]|jgi:elongation factor Ts|nr:translation elongation factor Ts [Bacillota bacterium]